MTRLRTAYVTVFLLLGIALSYTIVPPHSPLLAQSTNAITCPLSAVVSGAAAATVELVPLALTKRVYVCGFVLNGAGATTATFKAGTGTACASSTVNLSGPFKFVDGSEASYGGGPGYVMKTPIGNALCWTNSGTIQVSGVVTYAQF